jgi:hypothetical protein
VFQGRFERSCRSVHWHTIGSIRAKARSS